MMKEKYKILFVPQPMEKTRKPEVLLKKAGKQLKTGTIVLHTAGTPFLVWMNNRWKKLEDLTRAEKQKIIDLTLLPIEKFEKSILKSAQKKLDSFKSK